MYHDSAIKHVTGESVYIDDILAPDTLLCGKVVFSPYAKAKILSVDFSNAIKLKGVHAILSSKDIPGHNQMGPVVPDEPCLAAKEVNFIGQAVLLIAAESEEICRSAEKLIQIKYKEEKAVLNLDDAIQKKKILSPPRVIRRGEPEKVLKTSPHIIKGELRTGGQEHWYLETHICLCIPGEEKEINVYSSTQHPSETQALVAEVLGVKKNEVTVEVRRMGGAFGGKETQANHVACWTALLASATKKPVKIRLNRDEDQKYTGKRHPFIIKYETGFDESGKILSHIAEYHCDGGSSTDLTRAILERALLHADNCYFLPNVKITGIPYLTNLPSNTAFRGFGGPQGMACIEAVIDRIARILRKDAYDIRKINFYEPIQNNTTPYKQLVENNRIEVISRKLSESSAYYERRKEINEFNRKNEWYKKGIAFTPVKFGISFTTSFLNQAGALVNIYKDGSVLVNHGGTEMGQGLHTKIKIIAAKELGISLNKIKVSATNTSIVPNTSATAASAGTDLNGMAVKNAIDKLKKRIAIGMTDFFSNKHSLKIKSNPDDICFENDMVYDKSNPKRFLTFSQMSKQMHLQQVPLSATGFYRTPDIYFDKEKGEGRPFHYFAFGMAVTEVLVDTLTGFHKILRTDILHDVGDSLHKGIDIGQVEGGFIQGVGWCTTEQLRYDVKGNLLNHSPDTYKIPGVTDIPEDFRVSLLEGYPNPNTIRKSKAVAEPPLMLAFSAWLAIKDAVSAVGNHEYEPEFSLPATREVILMAMEKIKGKRENMG